MGELHRVKGYAGSVFVGLSVVSHYSGYHHQNKNRPTENRENYKTRGGLNEIMEDPNIHMHMRYSKWAEMAAWELLDEEVKKEIIIRKLDQQILHKEFKIGHLKHKVDTLKMMKQAMTKKKK